MADIEESGKEPDNIATNSEPPKYEVAVEGFENAGYAKTENGKVEEGTNAETEEKEKKGIGCFKGKKEKKKKEEKEEVKMVGVMSLFRFSDKWDVVLMVLGSLCAAAHGVALPALMIIFGDMTDAFVKAGAPVRCDEVYNMTINLNVTNMEEIYDTLMGNMKKYALYYFAVGCGVLVCAYGQVCFWLLAANRQSQKLRVTLFESVLRQEIGWFDTHEVGELNNRLIDDVNKVKDGIGDKIGNALQWFSTFIAGIIIGFVKGWKLALVIMAVSPFLAFSGWLMSYMLTSATSKELDAYARAGAIAQEVLSSIRTVVAFGGQQKECNRYNKNLDQARWFGVKKTTVSGAGMGIIYFIIFCTYALAFWYGSKLIREEEYTAGKMLTVFLAVVFGAFGLGNASPNMKNMATARGAAYSLWAILDRKSLIDSRSPDGEKPQKMDGNIEFRNVHFKYPSRPEVPILNGLNLKASVGQTVALVGASGCGKSTTVQLIQRFYDPLEGTVLIDGKDIKELNIEWLRQHIGVVSQEPILFGTTILENIKFGRLDVTMQEVEQATKMSNAYDFIMKLPKKFETLVGERGAQLSGGQKQRIAIARALVRDPKILLLDEATSALDTESESTVQEALDKARQGRTTIVVAHRLSTVRKADMIVGFREGVAHETGTHDELMELEGIYYTLVTHQKVHLDDDEDDDEDKFDDIILDGTDKADAKLSRNDSIRGSKKRASFRKTTSVNEQKKEEEEEVPEVSGIRILRANAPEWLYIIFGCLGAIVNGAVQPAFAVVFAEVIGVYAKCLEEQEKEIALYCIMFLVIGIIACLAMTSQGFMFGMSGEGLTKRMRQMAFKSMLRQEIGFFDEEKNNTGALTTRLSTEASAVQGATGARFGTAFQSLASVGTGVIIGFVYSWKLTLVILAFVPFIVGAGFLQMKVISGFSGHGQEALENAGKVATEAIGNIRTVASLTREPAFIEKYSELTNKPHKDSMKKAHVFGFAFSFTMALIFYTYAAAFYFGAWLIKNDGLEFQDMFKVFAAIVFGAMSIGEASHFAPDYGKGKQAAARLFALFDREPAIDSFSEEGDKPEGCIGEVEFKEVHFNYPSRPDIQVLTGLNLEVSTGKTVALVGSSGCGKSTTVQLIERFYDPINGTVTIDGKDIKILNIAWLRSKLGIVSQEPILFDCSIRDNIAYGDNSREVPMAEIIEAARKANIHSFVESLPDGYDTNVGDKGTQLSGGQKQRVAIARALLRNPKILLLDEATSALDTESEKVVQEALDRAQEGRTSIVIAHRLSTIQNADCIIVFHHGKVAEIGTHSELLAQKGIYYKLNNTQMKQISSKASL